MVEISVVAPVYKSAGLVKPFVQRVKMVMQQLGVSYEIVLIDDGSPDFSWDEIEQVCVADTNVKGILLSRNFGQHYAITAGLDVCRGNWVVVMDSDLQDRPEDIVALYNKALQGYEVVLCRRISRTHSWFKVVCSKVFYKFLGIITGKRLDPAIGNFGMYHRKVINSIVRMRESIRYFPMLILWVGFKKTTIDVQHGQSNGRSSGYNLRRLMRLALDIVLSFSDKPLEIVATIGGLISLTTLIAGVVVLFRYFNHSITVQGYTSLLLSIWFLSGLIIATLGIVGLYVGKTFQGIKKRPLYISSKLVNIAIHEKPTLD